MTRTEMVSMNVDPAIVESIIEANIQTAMLAAMGNDTEKGQILDAIVKKALRQKVNEEGVVDKYDSYNKHEYLAVAVQKMIRRMTSDAMNEFLAEQESSMKDRIKEALIDQSSAMADSLVKGLADSMSSQWRYKVDLRVDTTSD